MKKLLQKTIMVFISVGCLVIMQSCERTITDCDWRPWVPKLDGSAQVYTDPGPFTPPRGNGSVYFDAPDQKFAKLGHNLWVGQKLNSIHGLSYSTCVMQQTQPRDNVFFTIQIDTTNDDKADVPLIFSPYYQSGTYLPLGGNDQGPILFKKWQNWDLFNGYWFVGDFVGIPQDPEHDGQLYTLSQLKLKYPTATIQAKQYNDNVALSMRLTAGGPAFGRNFKGCVDSFFIQIDAPFSTTNFEDCQSPTP